MSNHTCHELHRQSRLLYTSEYSLSTLPSTSLLGTIKKYIGEILTDFDTAPYCQAMSKKRKILAKPPLVASQNCSF